jgi:hypothetical protein
VGRLTRPSSTVVWVAVVICIVTGAAIVSFRWANARDGDVQPIFEQPESFCEVLEEKSFRTKVADVEASTGSVGVRQAASTITVGFLRRTARLKDTPSALRVEIRELATAISTASESGDFRHAYDQATALDRSGRARCG